MKTQDFYLRLKSRLEKRFLVLRNVDLTSLLPNADLKSFPSVTLPIVIATRDYTPLLVIADIDHLLNQGLTDPLLIELRDLIKREGCQISSEQDAFYTSDEEFDRQLDVLCDAAGNRLPDINEQALQQKPKPSRFRPFLGPALLASSILLVYAGYQFSSPESPAAHFNITADVHPSSQTNSAYQGTTQKPPPKRIDDSKLRVCSNPPENGQLTIYPSDLKPTGKAYWVINNTTPLHVVAMVSYQGKRISELYVAPSSQASLVVVPYPYQYTIVTTDKWCSMYVMTHPTGYSPKSESTGQMGIRFTDGKVATTYVSLDRGSLDTSLNIEDAQQ